jgi:hypothetical protein
MEQVAKSKMNGKGLGVWGLKEVTQAMTKDGS